MNTTTPDTLVDLFPDHPRSGTGHSALTFDAICLLWDAPITATQLRHSMRLEQRHATRHWERIRAQLFSSAVIEQYKDLGPKGDPVNWMRLDNRSLAVEICAGTIRMRGELFSHFRIVPEPASLSAAVAELGIARQMTREHLVVNRPPVRGLRVPEATPVPQPPKPQREPEPLIVDGLSHEYSGTSARAASHLAVAAATYGQRGPVLRPGALDALRLVEQRKYGRAAEVALGLRTA